MRLAGLQGQVVVLVTDSCEVRDLNLRFRGQDKPTDVLSFPFPEGLEGDSKGDIAISAEVAAANAAHLGHSLADELKILTLHGILHLAGYDHETDGGEMARLEARLRRELQLPSALIQRTSSRAARPSTKASRCPSPGTASGRRQK
jgi:probable rRNA maturation factor